MVLDKDPFTKVIRHSKNKKLIQEFDDFGHATFTVKFNRITLLRTSSFKEAMRCYKNR